MSTCNTLFQPWIWLLFISIFLFIIFIIIIETYNIPTTNNTNFENIPNWIWIIFLFMLVLLFVSFIWYHYSSNICFTPQPNIITIPQPVIHNPCNIDYSCDVICDLPCNTLNTNNFFTQFIDTEEEIPLSCLNPFD